MKWFKHLTNASSDEFMQSIIDEFGLEGYARWWLILETIAEKMDGSDRCSVAYPWSKWQSILRGKRNKLETFLERLGNKSKINLKSSENILEIECPKLLIFRDEYSKKSGQSPDSTPDNVLSKNKDIRVKRRSKSPLSPKGEKSKVDKFDFSTLVYPLILNRSKWDEWLENRKTNGKRVTLIAARKQIAFLAEYSPEQQCLIIDQSIMNGYTGLFPPKGGSNGQAGQSNAGNPRPDNSAAGRVRAEVARNRAARAAGANGLAVADDGLNVRSQVGEQLRAAGGPGPSMGIVLEGDFERSD